MNKYSFSYERERAFLNHIKTGDFDGTLSVLDEIFDKRSLTTDTDKCILYSIASLIIRLIDMHMSSEYEVMVKALFDFETNEQFRVNILYVTKQLCQTFSVKKGAILCAKVRKMVEEEYNNPKLSVSYIANCLNLNYVYLSASFKSISGEGINEYITKVRIDKSKIFLNDPLLTISDVAVKVGYLAIQTFSRVFKKHEGITPSEYRKYIVSDKLLGKEKSKNVYSSANVWRIY